MQMNGEWLNGTAKQVTRTFSQKQLSFNGINAWNCESPAPANVIQTSEGRLS